MSPQMQALLWRFMLGLFLTEIPIATALLSQPVADYRLLALGLLGGLGAAIEKYVAPSIMATPITVKEAGLTPPQMSVQDTAPPKV